MTTLHHRAVFTLALGVTALAASCESLPDTQLKNHAGMAGTTGSGGASGGDSAAAGSAGTSTNGGMGASAGKAMSGAGKGSAGGGAGGSSGNGTGGSSGGKGGAGGKGGSGGTGGDTAGASDGGATPGGSSGSGGTFSTNRDDFFGDSKCAGSPFALCEDFESGKLDTGTWTPRGAAPAIETTRAARGTHSAHFHTTDNGLQYISETKTFPAPGNKFYGRVFVWFDSMPTAPDWAHWTISGASDPAGANGAEIRVGGQWDTNNQLDLFGIGTDGGDTGDWTNLDRDPNGKPSAVPVQDWACIEWKFDGGANDIQLWWDGVEHPSLHASATNYSGNKSDPPFILPDFGTVWFGWWLYQKGTTPPEFDTWIDEIAVDYERIGCNR